MTWRTRAACADTDPGLFYPPGQFEPGRYPATQNGPTPLRQIVDAKQVCAGCDVQVDCLSYALLMREPDGIWGGLTYPERRAVLESRTG